MNDVTLESAAEQILAWWQLGCVDSDRVTAWADDVIAAASDIANIPGWLCDLSLKGPREFVAMDDPKFPRPKELTYVERFHAMAECCDPGHLAAVRRFAKWCAREAMGEDLALPEVGIGYEIEHALSYDNSGDALEIARNAIKELQPDCGKIDRFFVESIFAKRA